MKNKQVKLSKYSKVLMLNLKQEDLHNIFSFTRPPLPSHLTADLRRKVPSAEFPGNPCRLLYCTQEMVIFREDIMTKMCRNCLHFPADQEDMAMHVC